MSISRRQFVRSMSAASLGGAFRARDLYSLVDDSEPVPEIFFDSDGLIVHRKMDGGDTSQREGWYWFGIWIRATVLKDPWRISRKLNFDQVLSLLEPHKDGVFYRHPKLSPWNNPYGKDFGFSRDQMVSLVAAMGVWNKIDPLRRLWNALPEDVVGGTRHTFNGDWIKVFGQRTVYTGDIVGPATINLFRRAWNEDPVSASDGNGPWGEKELETNVKLRLSASRKNRDDTGDDLNLIVMLLISTLRYPSATSAESVKLYRAREHSYGSYLGSYRARYGIDLNVSAETVRKRFDDGIAGGWKPDAGINSIYGAIRWYHRQETGANPALATLYRPIIEKYFT